MATRTTRLVSLLLLALLVGSVLAGGHYLGLAAPFSGSAWDTVDRGGERISNPYGTATVTYDEYGVPHVSAENERALYYAVGYVQARDRLFQMDLQRRIMNGTLAEAFGGRAVESDRFHRQMGFRDAAVATWEDLRGTDHGRKLAAFSAGVNRYVDRGPLPLEFRLNDYRPRRWTPVDSLLVARQVSWSLSGDFSELEGATVRQRLPAAESLYPDRLAHNATIIGRATGEGEATAAGGSPTQVTGTDVQAVYESVRGFEGGAGLGSNNWVVSGEHTASGEPILANDPHLTLTVPPVWYEMRLSAGETDVRGVGFPGIPFVIIGSNPNLSWGVTNVGADVTDHYTYRWRDGRYWYDGEWRRPETETQTVGVSDGENRTVTVRRTVHGPLIEREGQRVAVAWTGLSATNESVAFDRFARAEDMAAFRAGLREFDVAAQNFVAASDDGETLYYPAGRYPVRRVDGEVVDGDRLFNGSAGHGEWDGFTPYGTSTWNGFVPFEEIPHLENPGYVATANQRVVDDPGFYLGDSTQFADPYRGMRIYDLLEQRVAADEPVTREYVQRMQRDVHSVVADHYVPVVLNATDEMSTESRERADTLREWDHEMRRDSEGALVFSRWLEHFRNETFADEYYANGLDEGYYPRLWTLQQLPADSEWFDDRRTRAVETRDDIAARAMAETVAELEREGYETYGDYNRLDLDHPFPVPGLDYPEAPMDGSPYTIYNYRTGSTRPVGSSWRMIATPDAALGVIPGGNSGSVFSGHYSDQLDAWREGRYHALTGSVDGGPDIVFVEGEG